MKYESVVKHGTNTLPWERICDFLLMAQMLNNLPGMQGTCVQSLGLEDSLVEENDYLFQNFCLEKFMDRGAWPATVHGDHKELDPTERLTLSLSLCYQLSFNGILSYF